MAGVAAVVLAAGGGSRFQGPAHKLATVVRGRTVAAWAVSAAVEAGFDEVVVVTGAVAAEALALPAGVTIVHNAAWAAGQAGSLGAAVDHARALEREAVVVGLADQPFVPAGCWRAVGRCLDKPIVTATFGGERRPPVRLAAEVWDLLPRKGDEGARPLLRQRPDLVGEVACSGDPADLDTVEDLARWSC